MNEAAATAAGQLRAAFRTHAGRLRANNEDVPLVDSSRGVYGVIDGVGGHAAGEVAAAIARDVILQRLGRPLGTPAERVREAIALANNEIFRRAQESPALSGMTCVVTLAVLTEGLLTIGHVGDTRLYALQPDGIRKLTHDHSPVGEREEAQEITEAEAMRHPRRNEVFRDVGSASRDKDEEHYVEIIEEPLPRDAAILLCTDGLTDMISSAAVDRIVRRHAGDPGAVSDALVAAANEAGGRDNITVVYAESPGFAPAVRRQQALRPADPDAAPIAGAPVWGPERGRGNRSAGTQDAPARSAVSRLARAVVRSRATWFALGAIAGIAGALVLVWRLTPTEAAVGRTLVVGDAGGMLTRIADAMVLALPGDVISVEPGVYPERVVLSDGVSLVARIPWSVTLARGSTDEGTWTALTTMGSAARRISGIRIQSTPDLPMDVGMRIAALRCEADLMELAGPMRAGIELLPGAALTIYGSQIAVDGTGVLLGDRSMASAMGSVFVRTGRASGPPIARASTAQMSLRRNVFAGYRPESVEGASPGEQEEIATLNSFVAVEPGSR